MGSDTIEPTVGGVRLSYAMYGICLIHLLLCITIMSYIVVGVPLNLEGLIVSPLLQWIYGTFTLFSIIVIICAGVGTLYHIESHLNAYFYLLAVAAFIDFVLLVIFMIWGRYCVTAHGNLESTLRCGVQDGLSLLCLTALLIWRGVTMYLVRKCGRYVHRASNEKLIGHLERQGRQGEAEAWGMHPGGMLPSTSGQQHPGVPHPTSAAQKLRSTPGYGAMPMDMPHDSAYAAQFHAS